MPDMKRIAICIDDYGLHTAIDDAVLTLIEQGHVSATSCMVGAPAWTSDAPRLKEVFDDGKADAGLHIDLTEYPLDTSLSDSVGSWMRSTLLRSVDRDRVRAEVRGQLDRFETAMRRAPSHVDGHQHVHQFPVVRDIVVDELSRRYATGERPWLRSTHGAGRWRFKGRVIEAMGTSALETLGAQRGFRHNRSLLGVYDFQGGPQRYKDLMQQWLGQASDGDLLMAHVATAIVPSDEIAAARVVEWEVFTQEGFGDLLRNAGVTVARMSSILANAA